MHEGRKDDEGHKADWTQEKMESWNGKIRTVEGFRGLQSQGRRNIRIKINTGKEKGSEKPRLWALNFCMQ